MAGPKLSAYIRCVTLHLRILRWCGFCHVRDDGALGRAHSLYRTAILALIAFYMLQECVYAYQVRDDMEKVSRVMYLLLCHVTSIAKQLVFRARAARIDRMLDSLDEPLFNQTWGGRGRLLVASAVSARRFVSAYAGCAVFTCALWVTLPVVYHTRALPVHLPVWLYVDYNHSHTLFYMVMAYSFYATATVGIANTTMDAFIATVLKQCKTQLRILRINFEQLPQRAAELVRHRTDLTYDDVLMKIFLDCLEHYRKITETVTTLQNIFGTAILIQFGVGGWILCLAAYQIVSLKVLSIEFASTTLFIICILTELFLYCYYGNEVRDESERLCGSIYSMEWSRVPLSLRRSLLLVMERAKRPLRPAAGLIIPLSLETFVKIIRSSYTFYAVLRQTK